MLIIFCKYKFDQFDMDLNTTQKNEIIKNAGVTSELFLRQQNLNLETNKDKIISYVRDNVIGAH